MQLQGGGGTGSNSGGQQHEKRPQQHRNHKLQNVNIPSNSSNKILQCQILATNVAVSSRCINLKRTRTTYHESKHPPSWCGGPSSGTVDGGGGGGGGGGSIGHSFNYHSKLGSRIAKMDDLTNYQHLNKSSAQHGSHCTWTTTET
ncbi:hypothetical protein D5086_017532 [Populus alba]|uniref:Uncharacterized protein n=1 Tax=Populus alba TaxID=43335 RepID=A0ACC4BNJ8_POPAL